MNLAEVVARLVRSGMPPDRAAAAIQDLYLDIDEEFTPDQAAFCGPSSGLAATRDR